MFSAAAIAGMAILVTPMIVGMGLLFVGAGTTQLRQPINPFRLCLPVLAASSMIMILIMALVAILSELVGSLNHSIPPEEYYWQSATVVWCVVSVLIWGYVRRRPRLHVLGYLIAIIFVSSCVELLIAVSSHIVVKNRGSWSGDIITAWSIFVGIYVMLFALGSASILLLMVPRYQKESGGRSTMCCRCGYDLRGSIPAGATTCPECGAGIPKIA